MCPFLHHSTNWALSDLVQFSSPWSGGVNTMIISQWQSCQPAHVAWSWDKLLCECAIALGQAIDSPTLNTYSSALNSYLTFIHLHDLPVGPTPDMLSLYTIFMSHHIKPSSVTSYLSGICQQLEPYFPNVHSACNSSLVNRTIKGSMCKGNCKLDLAKLAGGPKSILFS